MQTFIYGNIGHKNFTYLCSIPKFFEETRRTKALDEMIRYDFTCRHADLEREQHQSFWMLTSDLDSGIVPRLFIHTSGAEVYRDGGYAQGYMCSLEDGDIYGTQFLKLLRAKFQTLPELMNTRQLHSLTISQLPLEEDLQPKSIPDEQMEQILLALFRRMRVVIRLKETGAAAMRASREMVLAIFGRLPYELRRSNGYVTGTSRKILLDEQRKLPKAFSVVLLDADAEVTGIQSDRGMFFLDLSQPEKNRFEPVPAEMKALIQFLSSTEPEKLDSYFEFCRQVRNLEKDGIPLDSSDYTTLLSFFRADREPVTDGRLRSWAVVLFGNRRKKEAKAFLYQQLARVLTPERLTEFLLAELPADQKIEDLGDAKSGDAAQRGVKALQMAQELQQQWDAQQGNGSVADALIDRMSSICFHQHEALLNTKERTVAVARELDKLLLKITPNAQMLLARRIQEGVYKKISSHCDKIKKEVERAGLCFIPKDLSLEETKEQLKTVLGMKDGHLASGDVSFPAWEEIGSAERILREIEDIESYSACAGAPQPRLVNPEKRAWVCSKFPGSRDLQIALAKQEEGGRARLVAQWAVEKNIGQWVERLYIHCWPEQLLKYGAGANTSESWRRAVENLFSPQTRHMEQSFLEVKRQGEV